MEKAKYPETYYVKMLRQLFTYMYRSPSGPLNQFNPFSAGTAFMLMQTGWIQASRRVTRRLA